MWIQSLAMMTAVDPVDPITCKNEMDLITCNDD